MKTKLLFTFLLLIFVLNNYSCKTESSKDILNKVVDQKEIDNIELFSKRLKTILKDELDTIDKKIFLDHSFIQIVSSTLVSNIEIFDGKITYKALKPMVMETINEFKSSENYANLRKSFENGVPDLSLVQNNDREPEQSYPNQYDHLQTIFALAEKNNKNILFCFVGYGDINWLEMKNLFSNDPSIQSCLKKNYEVVELYIDSQEKLPEDKQYYSAYLNKQVSTVGRRNYELMQAKFKNEAIPLFVIMTPRQEELSRSIGKMDTAQFLQFIERK